MFSKRQSVLCLGALVLVALTDWHTLSVCILLCCVIKVGFPLLKRKRDHSSNSNHGNAKHQPHPSHDHRRSSSSSNSKRLPFLQAAKSATRFTRFRKFTNEERLVWIEGNFLLWSSDSRRLSTGDIDTHTVRNPTQNVKQLAIEEIVVILNGKKTKNFSRKLNGAQKVDSDLCFSIISRSKCLDLQAVSRKEREVWVKGLYALVALKLPSTEIPCIPSKPRWYKQWPASQADMHAALTTHLRRSPRQEMRTTEARGIVGGVQVGADTRVLTEESSAKQQRASDAHFLSIWEPPPVSMANTGIWLMSEEDKLRVSLTREMLIQRKSMLQYDWEDYLLVAFLREVVAKSPGVTNSEEIARKNADILMKYENFLLSEVRSLSLITPHSSMLSPSSSSSSFSLSSPSSSSSSSSSTRDISLSSPSSSSSSIYSTKPLSSLSSSSSLASTKDTALSYPTHSSSIASLQIPTSSLSITLPSPSSSIHSPFSPPPLSPSLPLGQQTYLGILNHPEGRQLIEAPVKRATVNVFHGFDRQGRPIVFERTGRTDVDKLLQLPEQQILDAHILFLLSFRERLGRASQELKKTVPQFVYVLDMQDAGLTMRPMVKLLKLCASWDIEFMPNTVGVIYVINVPQTILWMYGLCSFFMDKDTAQKIQFLGTQAQWGPALRQCISDNQLPNEYGGTCTWCNGKGRECIPRYPAANA